MYIYIFIYMYMYALPISYCIWPIGQPPPREEEYTLCTVRYSTLCTVCTDRTVGTSCTVHTVCTDRTVEYVQIVRYMCVRRNVCTQSLITHYLLPNIPNINQILLNIDYYCQFFTTAVTFSKRCVFFQKEKSLRQPVQP